MAGEPLKATWRPFLFFMGVAIAIGIAVYKVPPAFRDVVGVTGIIAVIVYVFFVFRFRPENLQGVLAAFATVLGPAIADRFVRLRAPDLVPALESAGVIVQTTFVLIGILTTLLFAVEKLLTNKTIQGHSRYDIFWAVLVGGFVAISLSITPLTHAGGQSMEVLGMTMPQANAMLGYRVLLALLGVYLTLRPETQST